MLDGEAPQSELATATELNVPEDGSAEAVLAQAMTRRRFLRRTGEIGIGLAAAVALGTYLGDGPKKRKPPQQALGGYGHSYYGRGVAGRAAYTRST